MINKGCRDFISLLIVADPRYGSMNKVDVVTEFPNIFLGEFPSLPPNREIEFSIYLEPRMMSISKSPYRMAPNDLEDINK